MAIEVRYYTDPACSWSWGTEPKLRRVIWEFGSQLRFRWVMGGLAHRYGSDYRDDEVPTELPRPVVRPEPWAASR